MRKAGTGLLLLAVALAACGPRPTPDNPEPVREGGAYQAEYRDPARPAEDPQARRSAQINAARCHPPRGDAGFAKGARGLPQALRAEALSPGDLLDIRVAEDETFTGAYVVSRDGMLRLPFLAPIPVQGRAVEAVEDAIADALLAGAFFTQPPRLSVRLRDFAPARVTVAGAVFEPRAVEIGGVRGDEVDTARQAALGAAGEGRTLSAALRAAGGVRPDADLSAVELRRGGRLYSLDLRGAVTGAPFEDALLLAGDAVSVPSRGCFQSALMVPGPVSPPGITLFLSNLTQPATGNAPSAIGRDAREVPWGTRMMQAVVGANCVGGTRAGSAHRSAALFTRNPVTGASVVIERRIEDMRARPDRDEYDPWLLPGDAIACYDSNVTGIAEIARVLGLVGAAALLAD